MKSSDFIFFSSQISFSVIKRARGGREGQKRGWQESSMTSGSPTSSVIADAESEKEKAATYLSQVGQDSGSAMAADLEENKRSREETPEEDQKTQPSILPTSGKVKGATMDVAVGAGAASAGHERRLESRRDQ